VVAVVVVVVGVVEVVSTDAEVPVKAVKFADEILFVVATVVGATGFVTTFGATFLTTVFFTVAFTAGFAVVFTAGFGKTRVISDALADVADIAANIGVTSAITATEIAA